MAGDAVVDALRAFFAGRAQSVVCAYLYGSAARGEAHRGSDVDIAGEIERVIGKPVDIVVLNRASPDLVHRVLRDGVLLHESDRRARIEFETRKRAEYFDVLPYLRQYRRSIARRGP